MRSKHPFEKLGKNYLGPVTMVTKAKLMPTEHRNAPVDPRLPCQSLTCVADFTSYLNIH